LPPASSSSSFVAIAPAHAATTGESVPASLLAQELVSSADTSATYNRDYFTHWIDADANGCDTRQEVLVAESLIPVTFRSVRTHVIVDWITEGVT